MQTTPFVEINHPLNPIVSSANVKRHEPDWQTRWIETEQLSSLRGSWETLVENAIWRNPSLAPNFLLPALNHLASERVTVLIVEDRSAPRDSRLKALLPIERKRIYGLPFKAAEVWKHEQCFDSTPLLDHENTTAIWNLICKRLIAEKISLLSLDTVTAEKPLDTVFRSVEKSSGITRFQRDVYKRAAFLPAASSEEYIQKHVSKSIQKQTRRLLRRLHEQGEVTWEQSNEVSDYEELARNFLHLEASGWKGREGTALNSKSETRDFYTELIKESSRYGNARFLSLKLDGKPIAMLSDIQSGNVVYSYKTAYDDTFAKFSPGQQIEIKNLEMLHKDGIELGDSCTASDNSMINRIWGQKLEFQNIILGLQPGVARTITKVLPLVQSTVHHVRNLIGRR